MLSVSCVCGICPRWAVCVCTLCTLLWAVCVCRLCTLWAQGSVGPWLLSLLPVRCVCVRVCVCGSVFMSLGCGSVFMSLGCVCGSVSGLWIAVVGSLVFSLDSIAFLAPFLSLSHPLSLSLGGSFCVCTLYILLFVFPLVAALVRETGRLMEMRNSSSSAIRLFSLPLSLSPSRPPLFSSILCFS